MANRTVRVKMPVTDTDEFLQLIETVIKTHEAAPATSRLHAGEVADLKLKLAAARPFRETAARKRQEAQTAQEQFNLSLGTGKGQTTKTKGTCLNLITRMKKQLLLAFEGEEEQLESYGLKVVIGTAKPRGPQKPKA